MSVRSICYAILRNYWSKNSRQKSTDILDMSFTKNLSNYIISLNISNMLNEDYEKPATYAQDGRRLRIGFKKLYSFYEPD